MKRNLALVALSLIMLVVLVKGEFLQQQVTNQAIEISQLKLISSPHNFTSLEELKVWVSLWWTASIAPMVGMVLTGKECGDLAEKMQRDALADGFLMSICVVGGSGLVYDTRVTALSHHAGCMAQAGQSYYWIEPQTGEVVFVAIRGE